MTDLLSRLLLAAVGKVAWFLGATAANTVRTLVPIVVMLAVIWYFERRQGSDTARYRHRSFAHDAAYALFYNSGAFNLLGASLIYDAFRERLGFMQIGLLQGLPILVVGVLYVLLVDFINYWMHRAEHAVPFLWQFHSVHHAPEEINFLTAYRVHPFSKLMLGIGEILVLIVLGVPPTWWFPLTLVRGFLAAVQHTELDWSYGPFYRIVVSPVFHRLHHSSDRADFDSNYSQLFCIWDYMFGTANPARTPPTSVGVAGLPPEPTLAGQLWGPFRRIFRPRGGREAAPKSARRVAPSGVAE